MFSSSSFIFFYLMQPGPFGTTFRAQVRPYGGFGDCAADFTFKAKHIGHRPFDICSIDIEQYFFFIYISFVSCGKRINYLCFGSLLKSRRAING